VATTSLVCWKCGASLGDEPLPLARLAECRACNADLHVCRLCEFYDLRVARKCREPVADEVKDKERANFCDYFQPCPGAYIAPDTLPAQHARNQLDALFGHEEEQGSDRKKSAEEPVRTQLDNLFGSDED
jgi:hypothetical protein